MSLRDILFLTQVPIDNKVDFAAQAIKVLVSLVLQLSSICEEEDIEL